MLLLHQVISIHPLTSKNVFDFVLDDPNLWDMEKKRRNLSITNKNLGIHRLNHKVIEFSHERTSSGYTRFISILWSIEC